MSANDFGCLGTFGGKHRVVSTHGLGLVSNFSKKHPKESAYKQPQPATNVTYKALDDSIETNPVLGKRTEYLESESKKLTATVCHMYSQQDAILQDTARNSDILDNISRDAHRMKCEQEKMSARTRQLHMDQQWVYGKVMVKKLIGIDGGCGGMAKSLQQYRKDAAVGPVPTRALANRGDTVRLYYPMERVATVDGFQSLMKMKCVDPVTAAISLAWAIVYELKGDEEVRVLTFST